MKVELQILYPSKLIKLKSFDNKEIDGILIFKANLNSINRRKNIES